MREQLARLGDTPFELTGLTLETTGGPMVPKSLLNELRRSASADLMALRAVAWPIENDEALGELRAAARRAAGAPLESGGGGAVDGAAPRLHVLVRSIGQLDSTIDWAARSGALADAAVRLGTVYCDFEDVRLYKDAIARCRSAGLAVALGTIRIVKPGEEGFLRQISDLAPDAILVRNLSAMQFYRQEAPGLRQIADYSLNIANELTADLMRSLGVMRMVPSYDLNWAQLGRMFERFEPAMFEAVVHQHMPMFHMEHCVFAHTLSSGKDYRDCGRPCEKHRVELKDRYGQPHPLVADVGCRNTLFNAAAQSAAQYIPRMLALGLRHYRVELLREDPAEAPVVLQRYADLIAGKSDPTTTLRSLRVINQLGVTAGTLDRE